MGFLENLKLKQNGIKKSVEEVANQIAETPSMTPQLVMMNDAVNICAIACSACWDVKIPDGYEERSHYVGRRSKTGHTSVIEHANVVFYMYIPVERLPDLMEILDLKQYVHTCVKQSEKLPGYHVLVGGSWRAFSDLYLNCEDIYTNTVLTTLTKAVFQYIPSDGMKDLIDMGIFQEEDFANLYDNTLANMFCLSSNERVDSDIGILNCDDIYQMIAKISEVCPEPWLFTVKDLLKFVTVTVEFNHMSRIITQQLTRHRNAITQESQRYVDYSGAPFNSPALFKPEKYNPKRLYEFKFGGNTYKMNLQGIGDAINGIYPQLKDKMKYNDQALVSEDARGYLANNTQCGRLFMTFTYYSLIKFLQLREDSHAQAEIRSYATRIGEWFRSRVMSGGPVGDNKALYRALEPKMIMADDNPFKTPIVTKPEGDSTVVVMDAEKNEVVEGMTDEEYAKIYEQSIQQQDAEEATKEEQ